MKQEICLSGQFQIQKRDKDGNIVFDSGVVKNLILDTMLDALANPRNDSSPGNLMRYLAVGSGSSEPVKTQNKLESFVASVWQTSTESAKTDYNAQSDGEYYTVARTQKYRFDNLAGHTISELGLANGSGASAVAYTRALLKNSQNKAITITVLAGESLDIFYTLQMVYKIQDATGKIALSDGRGGEREELNYTVRLSGVGQSVSMPNSYNYGNQVGEPLRNFNYNGFYFYENATLGDAQNPPNGARRNHAQVSCKMEEYTTGSHKRTLTMTLGVNVEQKIGAILFPTQMGCYQIALTKDDGTVIHKTRDQSFSLSLELSWGRDERD